MNIIQGKKFTRVLTVVAIAIIAITTFAFSLPAYAQNSLCRATKVDTPIFQVASTTSNAIRIIPKDARVTLAYIPAPGSQFAELQSPSGFIQTAVLKQCGTPGDGGGGNPWDKPTIGTDCRQVVRPQNGVNIRRLPITNAEIVTKVFPGDRVFITLTTGDAVKTYRGENYIWVEVDLRQTLGNQFTGTGWMFNTDLVNSPNTSNLAYCN
ncbi:hypothetical protein [Iningainema tapete]|uniref:SH3b domain-containing protein n=1 Tax=Iningainema tapete BLCC-T55 TaxID=2748662 RepID=A0A8J7BX54_9CYAN|nr:hypothetical protein [Iningainema tapete]MBD2772263.1 hypothetical protein [Iningainema tapete BLCC-T55]